MAEAPVFNAELEARRAARQALEASIGDIVTLARESFDISNQVKAAAQPVLQLTEGITREINRMTEMIGQIDRVTALLEPHSSLPVVDALLGFFRAMKPVIVFYTASQTAALASLALTVPDPGVLGLAGLSTAIDLLQGAFDKGIDGILDLIDGEEA